MLKQARRALFLAHGFEMNDFHTICVYQRVMGSDGRPELVCRAHIRAIDCELALARVWKEGIGVAGTALAKATEVVVPDLTAPELGTLYNLREKKDEDDTRYRSIVAEPISLDGSGALWGVLIATSSRAGHFSVQDRSYVNVTEALAGMISLAVKLVRGKSPIGGVDSRPVTA
jgi:GAF domain